MMKQPELWGIKLVWVRINHILLSSEIEKMYIKTHAGVGLKKLAEACHF